MLPIHSLTIHCAATPEGRDIKAATLSQWARERFGQISYHYVIELDGNVVQTLPDNRRGAHTGGRNTGNLGVVYVGGCDKAMKPKDTRTPAQVRAMAELVTRLRKQYPGIKVRGHRDWPKVAKACPSFDVAAEIAAGRL